MRSYIGAFSQGARDVIDKFDFGTQITKLERGNLLYLVISKFADLDLHPAQVSNLEMGYLYEELVRRFSELSNETAGEHFTPREVIRLMVNLLINDANTLTGEGVIKTIFDPACGTGGMLSVAEEHLRALNPRAAVAVFGQELNAETYAICRSDMMLKGQNASNIAFGNSFSEDGHTDAKFDYLLANPPFGVEWKKVEDAIRTEAEKRGFHGRFGAGLPRINDGSFLFLQHMISKMKPPAEGGSRLAIVFNGSPLFTGAAGSGESEIRRWIIENDWLEAVVALPDQLFYNTGISTYFWIVTNVKSPERQGKVQLVDARDLFVKMRKSLGEKRKEISDAQIDEITRLYGEFTEGDRVKIFPNGAFGYLRVTVGRPLRLKWAVTDETIAAVRASSAFEKLRRSKSDPDDLRDGEKTARVLMAALESMRGTVTTTAGDMDVKLAGGLLEPWSKAGVWHSLTPPPWTPGMFASILGTTPPIARDLLAALAVHDDAADAILDKKGNPLPDPNLRDNENVPLPPIAVNWAADVGERLATIEYRTAVEDYLRAEVHPYVPDAWADHDKTKIDAEIKALEAEIQRLLAEVTE